MPEAEQEPRCRRCGDPHEIFACPHVKAIEFGLGSPQSFLADQPFIKRVEFLTPADFVAQRAPPAAEREPDYPRKGPAR